MLDEQRGVHRTVNVHTLFRAVDVGAANKSEKKELKSFVDEVASSPTPPSTAASAGAAVLSKGRLIIVSEMTLKPSVM